MTTQQLRAALRAHRLRQGWSYDDLAADIQRVNGDARVSPATARRFLAENCDLTERLEYAIRHYVEQRKVAA